MFNRTGKLPACLVAFSLFLAVLSALGCCASTLIPPDQAFKPIGWKLEEFLCERNRSNNVIILGSSLGLVPAARADWQYAGRENLRTDFEWLYKELVQYKQSLYLQALLSNFDQSRLRIVNLALTGAMVSDDEFVLRRIVCDREKPQLVILLVAPRDFVSNGCRTEKSTYICNQIRYIERTFPEFTARSSVLPGSLINGVANLHFHFVAGARTIKSCLVDKPLHFLGASIERKFRIRLAEDVRKRLYCQCAYRFDWKPQYALENALADLPAYRAYYQPPNWREFAVQTRSLEQLLAFGREHSIKLLVVNMPLTEHNRALLDRKLAGQYNEALPRICRANDAYYLDTSTLPLKETDFEDSAHLNAAGGMKFFQALASKVEQLY